MSSHPSPTVLAGASFAAPIADAATEPALGGFHMLAAITQDTINFQLKKLWSAQIIRRRLEIKVGSVGLAADLGPPRVILGDAERPGTAVFVLALTRGDLTYWDLSGDEPVKQHLAFAGWTYAFRVNLDFAQIARDAALDHNGVPLAVKRVLSEFSSDDFTIRHLFMNFQHADLASFEPAHTSLPMPSGARAPATVIDQFRQSLTTYFKSLAGSDNPYILGYSVARRLSARPPALFDPTGATFTTTRHATTAGLSTLDFLLMTEHAALPAPGAPRAAPRSWIESPDYDGRMVIEGAPFRARYVDGVLLPAVLQALELSGPWRPIATRDDAKATFELDDGRAAQMFPQLGAGARAVFRHTDNLDADPRPENKGCGVEVAFDGVLRHYREDRDAISCALWPEPGSDVAFSGRIVIDRGRYHCTYPLNLRTFDFGAECRIEQPFRICLVAGRDGTITPELAFGAPTVHGWSDIGLHLKPGDLFVKLMQLLGLQVTTLAEVAALVERGAQDTLAAWSAGVQRTLARILGQLETRVILPAGDVFFYKGIQYLAADDVVALDVSYKTERAEAGLAAPAAVAAPAALTHHHALMKHHLAAAPIAATHRIEVAQDAGGEPIVIAISEERRLLALHRQAGGATGWTRVDITPTAGAGLVPSTFALSQGRDGEIYLVVAMHPADQPEAARLFVAPALAANLEVTDWARLPGRWVERAYGPGRGRITRVFAGTTDDGHGAPLTLAAIADARGATHVRVNADAADTTWAWSAMPLPEDAKQIRGVEVGTVDGDRGVYTLYQVGARPALVFTTLPDPDYGGKVARYDFTLPGDATAIAVLPGAGASTDVYVAGAGLHVFRGSAAIAREVTAAAGAATATTLLACTDGRQISLWRHGADHRLDYVEGDGATWAAPVCLGQDVAQVAPIRNRARRTDALFTVDRVGRLRHRWFDPASDVWRATDVPLPSSSVTTEIDCYATQLVLARAGRPLPGRTLRIVASGYAYAIVNGQAVILDDQVGLEVATDRAGELTILQRIDGLAAATFTVTGADLAGPVELDPKDAVRARLAELRTGADLAAARTGTGKALFARPPSRQQLDAVAGSLQAMLAGEHRLAGAVGVAADAGSLGWAIGLAATGDVWVDLGRTIDDVFGRAVKAVAVAAGDILETMRQGIESITRIAAEFIDTGMKIIAEIGDRIVTFVLENAPQIYQMVQWLFGAFGIDLDLLVDLLGYVFPWDDIVRTQQVLAHVTRCSFDHGRAALLGAEPAIDRFFDQIAGGVDQAATLAANVLGTSLGPSLLARGGDRPAALATKAGPISGWLSYQLSHGGAGDPTGAMIGVDSGLLGVLRRFMTELVLPLADSLATSGIAVFDELRAAYAAGTLTVGHFVTALGRGLALGALDAIRTLVKGALRFLGEALAMIRDLIDSPLEIPVLTGLYRRVTGSDRMSVLEVLALACAVPATAMVKLTMGRAPFDAATVARVRGLDHAGVFAALGAGEGAVPGALAGEADLALAASGKPVTFGRVYSYVGGFVYAGAGLVSGLADVVSALNDAPDVDAVAGSAVTKFLVRKEVLQLALSAIRIGCSFPVGDPGFTVDLSRAMWVGSMGLALKDLVLLFVPEKFTGQRIVGGLEAAEACVEALAFTVMTVADLADTGAPDYNWPLLVWTWGDSMGGAAAAFATATTRFMAEPQSKAIAGAIAGGLTVVANTSVGLRTLYTVAAEQLHYNR